MHCCNQRQLSSVHSPSDGVTKDIFERAFCDIVTLFIDNKCVTDATMSDVTTVIHTDSLCAIYSDLNTMAIDPDRTHYTLC